MSDNFLNTFIGNSLNKGALPQNDCSDGYPVSKYSGYGVNSTEVLYSIYVANQSTLGAQFTYNQGLKHAPGSNPPCKGPANIIITRHAEKNYSGVNFHNNRNGIYRSCKLIEYINKLARQDMGISYIITCNPKPYTSASTGSMRPEQTVMMASFMLNIPMYIYGSYGDFEIVVNSLFDSGTFDGLNVLICWEAVHIQQLCLNILNKASGTLSNPTFTSRLPSAIQSTYPEWYGDAFFAYYGNTNFPDGTYLCQDASSEYYIDNTNLTYPGALSNVPLVIGPNSQYYPYWNNHNFEFNYFFTSNATNNYKFTFKIIQEPILTCYSSCLLRVGLYQPEDNYPTYPGEDDCEVPPSDWLAS
jgi:hypothetical protein